MLSRRNFFKMGTRAGLVGATASLWSDSLVQKAFAQSSSTYKAMILVSLVGGNDGNNMIIPIDSQPYAEYQLLRSSIAIPQSACLPLVSSSGSPSYGLHPALQNVAALYNQRQASFVVNVGPLAKPLTKAQLQADPTQIPAELLSHPAGRLQWATSSITSDASSGWGGRLADRLAPQSGKLSPVFNASNATVFTVGQQTQAISIQANTVDYASFPDGMNDVILSIANSDAGSSNALVGQSAQFRSRSMNQQVLIAQAQQAGQNLQTVFPNTPLGNSFKAIVQLMKGRGVVGASRQLFYTEQDASYDTHADQLLQQNIQLVELDAALGALMQGIQEIGLANNVLVCTSSDFNRTMQANITKGTDHAWGNHQIVLGGNQPGRILGTFPALELGGSADLTSQGVWIPTQSVTQMAAGIGAWLGLADYQLSGVFPDLVNFTSGPIIF